MMLDIFLAIEQEGMVVRMEFCNFIVKSGFFFRKIRCLSKRRLLKVRSYIGSIKTQNFRHSTFKQTPRVILLLLHFKKKYEIPSIALIFYSVKLKFCRKIIYLGKRRRLKVYDIQIMLYMIHFPNQTGFQSSGQKYYESEIYIFIYRTQVLTAYIRNFEMFLLVYRS